MKEALKYRVRKLNAARMKAALYGYKGAMYPWESAYTGNDVCPGKEFIVYEQHITSDIIHTLKRYIYMSGDWEFLLEPVPANSIEKGKLESSNTAWDMVYDTALFWMSRVKYDDSRGGYVIDGVMGPDEYHSEVNNSAFTNVVAIQNIEFALEVADMFNISIPRKEMKYVSENIVVPFDKDKNFHPEFDGFDLKSVVKQADTIMLGFPLQLPGMSPIVQKNDLDVYMNLTDSEGPAMTWSMFAINWMNNENYKAACTIFVRQFANIQEPFHIWSEVPSGEGAVNFLTGIGGYLQGYIYGFVGLRIHRDHLTMKPNLPAFIDDKYLSSLNVTNINYRSVMLSVKMLSDKYSIVLSGFTSGHTKVIITSSHERKAVLNKVGDSVTYPSDKLCKVELQHTALLRWLIKKKIRKNTLK